MALTEIPSELSSTPSIVDNGNSTAITIDASENATFAGSVGIGTSPASLLDAAGAPLATSGAILRIRNTSATASNTSYGGALFSSSPGTDFSIGKSNVNAATSLSFRNGNTGASLMELTSSGNLLVGKTSTDNTTAGTRIHPAGYASFTIANDYPIIANRLSSDGDIAVFRKDNTTVGSIGSHNGVPYIGYQGGTGGGIMFNGRSIEPTGLGATRTDGANDIGTPGNRWKDIYLSGGVNFSDANGGQTFSTGNAANTLSDYEVGTFTATLKGGSSGTLTAGHTEYTKIGNTVHCRVAFLNVNTTGYSGHLRVEGLPFPMANSQLRNVCTPAMYRIGAFTADYVVGLLESSTHVNFYAIRSSNTWNSVAHDAGGSRYLEFNVTYNTNA